MSSLPYTVAIGTGLDKIKAYFQVLALASPHLDCQWDAISPLALEYVSAKPTLTQREDWLYPPRQSLGTQQYECNSTRSPWSISP